jgi:processive 1,2-diacylglycerol beta-glucosyltransferase
MRNRPKRVLVLYSPIGGGHRRAAEAIGRQAASAGFDVRVADAYDHVPGFWARLHLWAFLTVTAVLPLLYGAVYDAEQGKRHSWFNRFRRFWDRVIAGRLVRFVNDFAPDVVVTTHYYPAVVLGRERTRGRMAAPLFVCITDFGAHDWWIEEGVDGYLVASDAVRRQLLRRGVPAARIQVTGIPIFPEFGLVRSLQPAAPGLKTVVLMSGGFGVGPMDRIVRSFAGRRGVRLEIVAGRNEPLRAHLRQVVDEVGVDATVHGFVDDVPALLDRAHVVISKPGGLTTCEALAAGRPIVFAGTVPGQESRNLEAVLEAGAGVTVAEPEDAADRVIEILSDPATLARYAAASRRLGRPGAAREVVLALAA